MGNFLSTITYRIEHVPGEKNVIADILTRRFQVYRGMRPSVRRISAPIPHVQVINGVDWPNRKILLAAQQGIDTPNGTTKIHIASCASKMRFGYLRPPIVSNSSYSLYHMRDPWDTVNTTRPWRFGGKLYMGWHSK